MIQGATTPVDTSTPTTYPLLPQIVRWTPRADTQEYLVKTVIEDKQSIKMVFEESFDRVSISFNDGVEYFPESYDASTKSTYYNLNPTYRNIVEGRNTYTVKAYTNDVHTATYELIVHYLSAPTPAAQEE